MGFEIEAGKMKSGERETNTTKREKETNVMQMQKVKEPKSRKLVRKEKQ